ncbi:MAG TPA: SDR family NAD(P)-dependent oxidoreductase, partial [Pirellulales bacterium]
MSEPQLLTAQVALVTGASSGIGRAIATALARAGADVIVHARQNRSGADATAATISALGRRVTVEMADLADPATHEQLVERAWDWQGALDILVNNAGADVLTGAAAAWSFEEKLERLWRVDVLGTIGLSRAIGERMQKRGLGTIVNIGWDQAEQGMAGASGEAFTATKGAIMAFSKSLARSLAPVVRVNCVAPGWIKTAWGQQASQTWQDRAKREALLARWGTPHDIAQAVVFL